MTFTDIERETLTAMMTDLIGALSPDGLQPGDPVYDRLYPDGYSGTIDEDIQQEFRDLTRTGIREERVERITLCRDELIAAGESIGRVEVDAEGYDRWLRVLNDLRLTLGTRLEIAEDDQHWDLTPGDPNSTAYLLYSWLTEVQDTVVRIALR